MKIQVHVFLMVVLLAAISSTFAANYYAAPAAIGDGSGSSAANAADYRSSTFWINVNTTVQSEPVTVTLLNGTYSNGALNYMNKGNATNLTTIQGESDTGVVLNSTAAQLLALQGSVNVKVKDLNFSGSGCDTYAIGIGDSTNATSNIDIYSCRFNDLTNAYYAAIHINNGQNITIRYNSFENVGLDIHAHMIYAANNLQNVIVRNNVFTDCSGAYVRFRNNCNDVNVADNTFHDTQTYSHKATSVAFIQFANFNDEVADGEVFGNGYTIHGNTFDFTSTPAVRDAIQWHHSGYEAGGFDQIPSTGDQATLASGAPYYKRVYLSDAGISCTDVAIYGNTYDNYTIRRAAYSWATYDGSTPAGSADIYNALGYTTAWSYNYEGDTGDPDGWTCSQVPPGTDVFVTTASAAAGTYSVRLTDTSTSQKCNMSNSQGTNITRGYYRTYFRGISHNGNMFPIYTNYPSYIYWIQARNDQTWGNNDGAFSGTPTWSNGTWYLLEMEFDFATDTYSVWVSNTRIANQVTIPTTGTSMTGSVVISPGVTNSYTGDMFIDYNLLGSYE